MGLDPNSDPLVVSIPIPRVGLPYTSSSENHIELITAIKYKRTYMTIEEKRYTIAQSKFEINHEALKKIGRTNKK